MPKKKLEDGNVLKSVFLAYFILIFHVLLLAGVGFLVVFLGGILNYMVWVLAGVAILVLLSLYLIFRYLHKESVSISKLMTLPEFAGQNVEVRFLGGLASFKISNTGKAPMMIGDDQNASVPRLEDLEAARTQELTELGHLLEKGLISSEEFSQAKKKLFDE